jgi:magnesium chelatase family protein
VQQKRFRADGALLNSRMSTRQLRRHCVLDEDGKGLLKAAMDELGLSARAHDRILRVARTIADLEGSADIKAAHVIEAIGYRSLDRKLWGRGESPGGSAHFAAREWVRRGCVERH